MDGLLVLLILVALAIPVSIIVLLVGQSNLRGRIDRLERAFRDQRAAMADAAQSAASVPDVSPPLPSGPELAANLVEQPGRNAMTSVADETPASLVVSPFDLAKTDTLGLAARAQAAANNQNRPLVVRPDRVAALIGWLTTNWVYAVSALSLALAGVFFVQYGMEKGLLPPGLRVIFALVFGAGLIAGGEWLRRRSGDGEETDTAYLPSVFAGAGIVTVFAAILAARQLYGLIGPQMAFAGHIATAILAIGLGWIYGPLLVAVGLLGAALAPFVVAGDSDPGPWLYAYFALITGVGLAVDAIRRWAWVSVLALVLGYGTGWLMVMGGAGVPGWIVISKI